MSAEPLESPVCTGTNRFAHELHTGTEFWQQADGQIDAFCDFVGTGGTYAGVTTALKKRNPTVQCYIVEPEGAGSFQEEPNLQGRPPHSGWGLWDPEACFAVGISIDGYLQVDGLEAQSAAGMHARRASLVVFHRGP